MSIPLVQHPESVVLVVPDGDALVVVRQTRPGAPQPTLELPSGKLESSETPTQAAARELVEECGLAATSFRPLGSFWVVPAYSTERTYVFEAIDLTSAPAMSKDPDEDIKVERLPIDHAWEHLSDGTSLAALALWLRKAIPRA